MAVPYEGDLDACMQTPTLRIYSTFGYGYTNIRNPVGVYQMFFLGVVRVLINTSS